MVVSFSVPKTFHRTFVVVCGIVLVWIWLCAILGTSSSRGRPAPTHRVGVAATRNKTYSNEAGGALSELLFPLPSVTGDTPWIQHNHKKLRAMFRCIENENCTVNQMKVVLLASHQFRAALQGDLGGEKIWAISTAQALENLGYTHLYTASLYQTLQIYQMFPSLVKAIFADDDEVAICIDDSHSCTQSAAHPSGIPSWKLFAFAFWAQPAHPLGPQWTLSPEDYKSLGQGENTYLGYSIEDACNQHTFVPHAQRGNDAYILAKLLSFFTPERDRAWASSVLDAATTATGVRYVFGAINDTGDGEWSVPALPRVHVDYGEMGQHVFMERLAKTRVLIGMGNPMVSPTPYDALCMGIPFINPILEWDPSNPMDRTRWTTQHPPLAQLDSPYVYNIHKDDSDAFVRAVRSAMEHPIDRYVLERMKMSAVERRLTEILERDWEAEVNALEKRADTDGSVGS